MSNQQNDPDAIAKALAPKARANPSQALREKYQSLLELVWRKPDNCPICDSSAWNVGDLVDVQLRHAQDQDAVINALAGTGRKVYVYVPVTCVYCGYTLFFHSGVLDTRDAEVVKAEPPIRFAKRPRSTP
jgi:hypothetical protein